MDYTLHGILQPRTLEWVAFPFSKGSSQPRDQTQVSYIAGGFFTSWATREATKDKYKSLKYKKAQSKTFKDLTTEILGNKAYFKSQGIIISQKLPFIFSKTELFSE